MKKTIFLIERSNEVKYFAPIIETFQKQKIEIEIFTFISSKNKNNFKNYLNFNNVKSNLIKGIKIKRFYNKNKFHDYCIDKTNEISYIFSLVFLSRERFKISAEFLDAINTKWCVVGHGADSFLQFENENTYLKYSVNFFFTSKFFFKEGKEYIKKFVKHKNIFDTKKVKTHYIGNTMFSKKIFTKKSNFKKKLIYLPFPFLKERYGKDFAFQAAYSGQFINYYSFLKNIKKKNIFYSIYYQIKHYILNNLEIVRYYGAIKNYYQINNELSIVKSIRVFCDKNDFKFIVKPRLKFPFIDKIYNYADQIIYDEESSQYPTLFQKEISSSDIVIGSLSSSVYEVAMFKLPYVNIEIPEIAFRSKSNKFIHKYNKNLYYNYNGVVFNYKISDFIKNFQTYNFSKFKLDKKKSHLYLKKFCGIENNKQNIGEKVLKVLKNNK